MRTAWNKTGQEVIGQKFGRLTIIELAGADKRGTTLVKCRCECGGEKTVIIGHLRRGVVQSCGCFQKESRGKATLKHGNTRNKQPSKEYIAWQGMRARCTNKSLHNYYRYGGRGITYCDRWGNFEAFLEDMGPAPEGFELDRIDPEKGYCKENCRWTTKTVQAWNKSRTRYLDINGVKKPLEMWRRELAPNVSETTVRTRFLKGWPIERLFLGTNGKNKTAK